MTHPDLPSDDEAMLIFSNCSKPSAVTISGSASTGTLEPFMRLSDIPFMKMFSANDAHHGRPTFYFVHDPDRSYFNRLCDGLEYRRDFVLNSREDFWDWLDDDGGSYIADANA